MSKYQKWIILGVVLVLLTGASVAVFGFLMPWYQAKSAMPAEGSLTIEQQEDGALILSWPEADNADRYCIEILQPPASEDEEPKTIYRDYGDGLQFELPRIPDTMELTLRVTSVVDYRNLLEDRIRFGDNSLEVTTTFDIPVVTELTWSADPERQTVSIQFKMKDGDKTQLSVRNGSGELLDTRTLDREEAELAFGDMGELPMPGFGEMYSLSFEVSRQTPGLTFRGDVSAEIDLVRDDLLGRNLVMTCTDLGDNVCRLTWNETKGETYQVQAMNMSSGDWVTVYEVPGDGERSYTSPHLDVFSKYIYRVVAVGGQTMEGSPYAAVSDALTFTTMESAIYATIWTTKKMDAYADSEMTQAVAEVKAGQAFCVLAEENGAFAVGIDGEIYYIDSNYCMINLPEYLGSLCSYNITNSYSSIYMVHEFEIPQVTNVVTKGYENVRLSEDSFLVPLLYPTAQKLLKAAQEALTQGYRLKIYDSFRPYVATRQIYDLTAAILDQPIPEEPFTGVDIATLNLPAVAEGETLTYRQVMISGSWGLSSFLAKNGSMHNLGIALDLTLERASNGEEQKMQTSMHDLSHYSVLVKNNSNAKTLASIMKGAGFGDLSSEWWHFQDNEARKNLSLSSVVNGISAACWMRDDIGWKYRKADGSYYKGTTVKIDGTEYTFNEQGYVT